MTYKDEDEILEISRPSRVAIYCARKYKVCDICLKSNYYQTLKKKIKYGEENIQVDLNIKNILESVYQNKSTNNDNDST